MIENCKRSSLFFFFTYKHYPFAETRDCNKTWIFNVNNLLHVCRSFQLSLPPSKNYRVSMEQKKTCFERSLFTNHLGGKWPWTRLAYNLAYCFFSSWFVKLSNGESNFENKPPSRWPWHFEKLCQVFSGDKTPLSPQSINIGIDWKAWSLNDALVKHIKTCFTWIVRLKHGIVPHQHHFISCQTGTTKKKKKKKFVEDCYWR